jgi:pantoate--beta-alanine ligase
MQILTTIPEAQTAAQNLRATGSLGLVPTMGALHAGHLSLIAAAKRDCTHVAATIFVNPLQFAPTEDFTQYPRTFDEDCALLESAGVDILFAPSPEIMTPKDAVTFVEVPGLSDRLDGAHCPIIRESDGLAMSSRNRYLSPTDRTRATILYQSLLCAAKLHAAGEHRATALIAKMREHLAADPALTIEYTAAVDPGTLLPVENASQPTLLAIAVKLGTTRLIDNILLQSSRTEATHA